MNRYFLCDPMALTPSMESSARSPFLVLVEVPSQNPPDSFLPQIRLSALMALRHRFGDGYYQDAVRQINEQPGRLMRTEERTDIKEETLGPEDCVELGWRLWFVDYV
jgi:hypothetical protein